MIQTNDNQTRSGIIDLWADCLMENKAFESCKEDVRKSIRLSKRQLDNCIIQSIIGIDKEEDH